MGTHFYVLILTFSLELSVLMGRTSWSYPAYPGDISPNVHRKSDSREACDPSSLSLCCAELGPLVLSLASSRTLKDAEEYNVTYSHPLRESGLQDLSLYVPCSCPYQMCLSLPVPTRKQIPDDGNPRTPAKQGFDPQYFGVVVILQSQELGIGTGA